MPVGSLWEVRTWLRLEGSSDGHCLELLSSSRNKPRTAGEGHKGRRKSGTGRVGCILQVNIGQ